MKEPTTGLKLTGACWLGRAVRVLLLVSPPMLELCFSEGVWGGKRAWRWDVGVCGVGQEGDGIPAGGRHWDELGPWAALLPPTPGTFSGAGVGVPPGEAGAPSPEAEVAWESLGIGACAGCPLSHKEARQYVWAAAACRLPLHQPFSK